MSKDPKTLALRWFHEVWNLHQEATIHELLAPGAKASLEGGPVTGPDELIEKLYRPMLEAFPDIQLDVEGIVAEGNDVATRWTATATHPDGCRFSFAGMTWMTFEDGRIVAGSDRFNLHALNHYIATRETSTTVKELPSTLLA